ncbi:MAG: hypothetical protein EBR84_03165, partial [Actinobacteria bacterium]|nr:hypothetical protein [Actinomycetota bacterium]
SVQGLYEQGSSGPILILGNCQWNPKIDLYETGAFKVKLTLSGDANLRYGTMVQNRSGSDALTNYNLTRTTNEIVVTFDTSVSDLAERRTGDRMMDIMFAQYILTPFLNFVED